MTQNSFEIEHTYDSHTWLNQKFDRETWVLNQDFDVDQDWTSNDSIVLNRDNLKTLHAALTEILKEE